MAKHDEAISILTSALARQQFPTGEWRTHEGTPSKEVRALPFYSLVPKDPILQMKWRIYVRDRIALDDEFKHYIDYCCSKDILFAFNTLFWIFETRPVGRRMPFNTWTDQDDYIVWFKECIDKQRDAIGEKCRGVGWSYLGIGLGYYDWRWPPFNSSSMIGFISRKKEAVDSGESDSLFWKLDYIHRNMPEAFRLDANGENVCDRTACRFVNQVNASAIIGYEAGPNAMTGGRKRWILHDEAAKFPYNAQEVLDSTQHVTNCRLVISTFYRGTTTRFFQMARKEKSGALRVIGDWKSNPDRAAGLYTFEKGVLKILNHDYTYPEGYKFIDKDVDRDAFGGRVRSAWYDAECERLGATRRSIAEEIDRDPQNTGDKFFEGEVIEKMETTCRLPNHIGVITYKVDDPKISSFISTDRGSLEVWAMINSQNEIVGGGPYSAGIDLAAGGGGQTSAYSSLAVIDEKTGEQVLEFNSNKLRPDDFADHCFAIFWWLCRKRGQGHLVCNFEANSGLGTTFGTRMVNLGWGNFYKRRRRLQNSEKIETLYGWFNRDRGEAPLFELQRAVHTGECVVRSHRVKNECQEYERDKEFKLIHASSDASRQGDGKAHGDSAIAFSLAWMARQERTPMVPVSRQRTIDPSSLAGMALAEEAALRASGLDTDWDEPNNGRYLHPLLQAIDQSNETLNFDVF